MTNTLIDSPVEDFEEAWATLESADEYPCKCGTPDGEIECPRCNRVCKARAMLANATERLTAFVEANKRSEIPEATAIDLLAQMLQAYHESTGKVSEYGGMKAALQSISPHLIKREYGDLQECWQPLKSILPSKPLWLTKDGSEVFTGYAEPSGDTFQCFYPNGSEICGVEFWMQPILPVRDSVDKNRYVRAIIRREKVIGTQFAPTSDGPWSPDINEIEDGEGK